MDKPSFVFDRRALAEQQVLSPIRSGLHAYNLERMRGYGDAGFLQHLLCPCLLPSLAEHLISARKRQLTLTLTREGASDHQQAAPEGHQDDDDYAAFLRGS